MEMLRLAIVFCLCMHAPVYGDETAPADETAERELDAICDVVLDAAHEEDKALLEKAQSAWRWYRQAHCDAIEATTARSFAECSAYLAHERAIELRDLGRVRVSGGN
jgi:uncharacterized protein YecT (DUF1311 family)